MFRLGQAPCMGRRANPARAGRQQRYRRPTSAVECLATSFFPSIPPLSATGYQVIARKWRPQTFGDVVGQDHVVRTLKNAINRGRIAHAYLFVGPRGTGKTSIARIFAKALNCTGGPKADFDPLDPAVIAIAEGSHLDVIEIDGASNNSVDQVRDLRESARYVPAQGKFKIYIIDEVHMLSGSAFNALLKTLEEPPAHVKFVFATTEVQKVLPTILSRCQRFDLRPIPSDLIAARLKSIAESEKVKVNAAALACIARLADGGMRDAQSILDQMIAFCGGEIAEADVLDVYGLVAEAKVAELAGALAAGDHRRIVAIVDECDAAGRDLVRLLTDLQAIVRTVLLESIADGGSSSRLGVPMTTEQLTRLLDGLREGEGSVKLGLAEKINFEVTLLKAVEASRSRAIDSLIKELASIAGEVPAGDEKKKD
jgi:DNA polymerase III subunit gamma/tau